jgi:hypothetical protein
MHLYGDSHEFESGDREEGGYAVRITIPFRLGRLSPNRDSATVGGILATVSQT